MRYFLIPLFRILCVLFKLMVYAYLLFASIAAIVFLTLWTFKPIDSFYMIYSDLSSQCYLFREYSAYSITKDKYFSWKSPIAYIFDVNNENRFETDNAYNRQLSSNEEMLQAIIDEHNNK